MEITPTIEEIRDGIDTVGTGLERRVRKQEHILIPNKPTLEDIINWLGLRKDYAFWADGSSVSFMDLYVRFGNATFYVNYNQEFRVTFREWDGIRPLAFTIALLGTMVFPQGPSLSINTRVIMLAHTLFHGHLNQGKVKYYPIAPVILSDMYRALGKCKEGHRYFQGCNLLLQWWILSHLAKGHGTQKLHTLDDNNSLKGLNDMLFWTDLENRRTRGRWAQIFSELREENIQWMFDHFISKDAIVRGDRKLVLLLPGI
uniref:Aminotransferase-like plant mobile domain-containing protein n=1 Tax=Solanum tuberosum TaxID=4113 RepID=M1CJZ1_SOLTU